MGELLLMLGLVALGGGIGGMARFWVSGRVAARFGETFPWGTMVVNVTGAAAIGALAALLLVPGESSVRNLPVWSGLAIGALGSYTTVSSFSLQTLALARGGETGRALANIALSLGLSLLAVAGGWLAADLALAGPGGR